MTIEVVDVSVGTLVEYALILFLIAIVSITVLTLLGTRVSAVLSIIADAV